MQYSTKRQANAHTKVYQHSTEPESDFLSRNLLGINAVSIDRSNGAEDYLKS